jgi:hypothetical protein
MTVINTADKIYVGSSLVSKVYSGTNLVWPTVTLDAATVAWAAAVVSAGGTVSSGRKTVIDTYIKALKTAGLWAKIDRLWLLAAENSQSALINLIDPAATAATAVNSPTFTANRGYTSNGTSSYVDGGYFAGTGSPNYTQNSASYYCWQGTVAVSTGPLVGSMVNLSTGSTNAQIITHNSDGNVYAVINAAADALYGVWTFAFTTTGETGLYVVNRTGSTTASVDLNGVERNSAPYGSSSAVLAGNYMAGLGIWPGGSGYGEQQCSLMGFGGGLTTTERTAFNTHTRTCMTSIGVP